MIKIGNVISMFGRRLLPEFSGVPLDERAAMVLGRMGSMTMRVISHYNSAAAFINSYASSTALEKEISAGEISQLEVLLGKQTDR